MSKFFKIFEYFFDVREINVDFVKENNFLFICYFEMCKMLFLILHMDQIYFV